MYTERVRERGEWTDAWVGCWLVLLVCTFLNLTSSLTAGGWLSLPALNSVYICVRSPAYAITYVYVYVCVRLQVIVGFAKLANCSDEERIAIMFNAFDFDK